MSFEIRLTREAEETYDAVVTQLRQRWGDRFVNKFEAKVLKCFDTITKTPYIYPIAEENIEIRKCLLHKNCSMLYKVYDEVILIVCFWDTYKIP